MYEGNICKDCGSAISMQEDKAVGTGEVQEVWTDVVTDEWVCPVTGDEHAPADRFDVISVSKTNALMYARLALNTLVHPDATSDQDFALMDFLSGEIADTLSDMIDEREGC